MLTAHDVTALFWSRVWRCTHRLPCRRCCWPWQRRGMRLNPRDGVQCLQAAYLYATFFDPLLGRTIPAHRYAYMLAHGALLLPGRLGFVVRHLVCDFRSCCNPAHLAIGTQDDNMRDKRGKTIHYGNAALLCFPDGTWVDRAALMQQRRAAADHLLGLEPRHAHPHH